MKRGSWLRALVVAGALTNSPSSAIAEEKVDVHILDEATPEAVVSVIQVLNPHSLRPGTALYKKYYNPKKLREVAEAIVETCQEHNHPVALYIAYFQEQSRFQYDAVSRWNQCEPGEEHCEQDGDKWYRRVAKAKAWKKPIRGLDYGIAQIHYPANRLLNQDDVKKLKDPVYATRTFARWMDKSMARCKRSNNERCREMLRLTGWSWYRRPGAVVKYLREIIQITSGQAGSGA